MPRRLPLTRLRPFLVWLIQPSNRASLALALVLGLVFAGFSVLLARQQALDEYRAIATQLARYTQQRTDQIREYTHKVFRTLRDNSAAAPCSDDNLALMRRLSYGSDLIVDLGYVQNGRLLCSTSGRYEGGIAVGEPDFTVSSDAQVRLGVRLPFTGDTLYSLSTTSDGYTAIMRADWSEDVLGWMPDAGIAIGTLYPGSKKLLFSRGHIDTTLLDELSAATPPRNDRRRLVAQLHSADGGYVAFAVIPTRGLYDRWHARALEMVPAGVLLGLLLAALVSWATWRQSSMPTAIRAALRRNEFHMVYQPMVELATGRWVGLEALIRWRKPNGAMIPPDVFIPIAERSGLIRELTTWVARKVLHETHDLLRAHPDFHVALNVTGDDLLDGRLRDELGALATRHGVAPSQLISEITERIFANTGEASEQLRNLRALGVQIAIDDFGTGYSSLAYLTQLELDYLKIDKTFVDPICTGAVTASVIGHIIAMAQSLGLVMIAEGVETQAQADYLRDQGVQLAQGWLFARPMSIREIRLRMEA